MNLWRVRSCESLMDQTKNMSKAKSRLYMAIVVGHRDRWWALAPASYTADVDASFGQYTFLRIHHTILQLFGVLIEIKVV